MSISSRNKVCSILITALRVAALLCVTGPIMQAFLASLGFDSQALYIHTTLVQFANVATIMLCAGWADKGNLVRRCALVQLPHALLYLGYVPLCLGASATLSTFVAVTGICLLQSMCIALYTVCEYKLPYYIWRPQDYGPISAVSGIAAGVLTLLLGALVTKLTSLMAYGQLMLLACLVSAVLTVLSTLLTLVMQPLPGTEAPQPQAKSALAQLTILRHRLFLQLLPANLARGFATGTTTVLAAVALELGHNEATLTALVTCQSIATLVGCAVFGLAVSRLSPRWTTLIGALFIIPLPLVLLGNATLFLVVYTLVTLGRTFVDYSVPALLRFAVPVDIAGPYNAWRMLLHNGGTLLATTIAAFIPVEALLILTVLLQLYAGFTYFTNKTIRDAA
jgi:hypothetical protein